MDAMDLPITTPALLFPAIAILMLGYINRYQGTANVIRSFKKDYDTGYVHVEITKQLNVLKRRIELSRFMIIGGAVALGLACLSMLLIYLEQQRWGELSFALSITGMIISLVLSLYETRLSNDSLKIEIDDIITKERTATRPRTKN